MSQMPDRRLEGPHERPITETTTHRATVSWDGDRRDLRAHTIALGDRTLASSCTPELGGDASKADPEGLFVASLSACHMLWFLDFTRRERLRVVSYEDRPVGTMDGVRFVNVTLRPRARFASDVSPEVIERLHRKAHEACFIANSVICEVKVMPDLYDAELDKRRSSSSS